MPAMLIVEAMAQTAAVLGGCTLSTDCRTLSYFAGLDRARFRAPVTPGDTLELHVKKHRRHAAVWQFTAEARVDHKVVAEALFTAVNMGRAAALSTVLGQFGQAKTTSRDGAAPPL
jgi:3-hydroxyacyl-[acyl-carrier-protein] dehydratase